MKDTLEKRIIAAQPPARGRAEFVARTMEAVKQAESRETFSNVMRRTSTKQESVLMKLKHLPGIAVALIIISALLLVSGTAYAAYKLWFSPEATVISVEQKYGSQQALIDLKNCNLHDEKVNVEINKNKTDDPDVAAKSLLAQCEIDAIQNWAQTSLGEKPNSVSFAFSIEAIDGERIILIDQFQITSTIYVTDDSLVIYKGDTIKLSSLRAGDVLALVISGSLQKPRAVVKLSLPSNYYDYSPELQNSYHIRYECSGNPTSSCITLPSLDVLREGEGGANPQISGELKYIQGKLLGYTSTSFQIQSTSGEIYLIHTVSDVIGAFNAGNPYGAVAVEVGDVLEVRYTQPTGGDPKEILSTQYHNIQLMLQEYDKMAKMDKNLNKYHYE